MFWQCFDVLGFGLSMTRSVLFFPVPGGLNDQWVRGDFIVGASLCSSVKYQAFFPAPPPMGRR